MSMSELARSDSYDPNAVDWSRMNQPFGTLADPNPVQYSAAGGRVQIRPSDINTAMDVALGASGGGLATKPIRAYHGSPHDFDRFDLSKIGTGEGAQVYGHGLYFAEAEPVAQSYKRAGPAADAQYVEINSRLSQIAREQEALTGQGFYPGAPGYDVKKAKHAENAAEYSALMDKRAKLGHMYEVNINADPAHFLDWDKPLSQQPAVVSRLPPEFREQMAGYGEKSKSDWGDLGVGSNPAEYETGQAMIRRVARPSFPVRDNPQSPWKASGAKTYEEALAMVGGDKSRVNKLLTPDPIYTTEALREAGIPGIKYLDQGSRNATPILKTTPHGDVISSHYPPPTSNYVVFNDKLIDILRKYGLAGAAPAGIGALAAQDQYQGE